MKIVILSSLSVISLLISYVQVAIAAEDVVGTLQPPASIISSENDISKFFSTIIILIIVVAGLWSLFQFLIAGFTFITGAGDPKKTSESQQKITHAIIGLGIITISFLLAAIIGQLFFGNALFILAPNIKTFN